MTSPPILGDLDRTADRPPFRQIADHLRAAITTGRLQPGDKLPSEADLMAHYGVARMTTRQAIGVLRSEGLVMAEQGRGVFVTRKGEAVTDQAMPDCCRASVVHELREQTKWMREKATASPVGDGFAPGILAAARSLEQDADTLEHQEEREQSDQP